MVNKLQNRKILKSEGLVFTSRCVVLLPDPGDRNSLRHKKLFSARPKNVGIISISRTNIADENFEFHSLGRVFFFNIFYVWRMQAAIVGRRLLLRFLSGVV